MFGYSTIEEVNEAVRNNQGILSVQMVVLRDCLGYDKIGNNVKEHIKTELHKFGIGVTPKKLPSYQHEWVIVYLLGSPIAKLIEAVDSPNSFSSDFINEIFSSKIKFEEILSVVAKK